MKRAKSQRHILAAVTIQRKISVSILSQEFENERILPSIGIKRIIRRKQQSCLYSQILDKKKIANGKASTSFIELLLAALLLLKNPKYTIRYCGM